MFSKKFLLILSPIYMQMIQLIIPPIKSFHSDNSGIVFLAYSTFALVKQLKSTANIKIPYNPLTIFCKYCSNFSFKSFSSSPFTIYCKSSFFCNLIRQSSLSDDCLIAIVYANSSATFSNADAITASIS